LYETELGERDLVDRAGRERSGRTHVDRDGEPATSQLSEAQPPSNQRDRMLEIEVEGRWDALALSELLIPFHSFLVQHDRERWVVHARAPGCRGEPLTDALETIANWRAEQRPRTASCRVASFQLGGATAA
jgi:hypothetical protein